jgi:CMP-2-keto-3-deoxyoctulosonic acid synthetase
MDSHCTFRSVIPYQERKMGFGTCIHQGFILLENKLYWIFLQLPMQSLEPKIGTIALSGIWKTIKMVETHVGIGIDTPEDLEKRGACYNNNFWLYIIFSIINSL